MDRNFIHLIGGEWRAIIFQIYCSRRCGREKKMYELTMWGNIGQDGADEQLYFLPFFFLLSILTGQQNEKQSHVNDPIHRTIRRPCSMEKLHRA